MITITCHFLTFFLLLHSLVHNAIGHPYNITTDAHSLLVLMSAIRSNNPQSDFLLRNWTTTSLVCEWYGVTCSSRNHRVVSLNISNMGLKGVVPPHIGNLSFLNTLDVHRNALSGQLPSEMARLRRLEFIDLNLNNYIGDIPLWIGNLSRLQHLSLANNSFTGVIPSSLFNLSALKTLDASFNQLRGSISPDIGNLRNLRILDLAFNQLTGPVTPVFNTSTLEKIWLTSNRLTGTLPACVHYNLPNLQYLYLSMNGLTGTIPDCVSNYSMLIGFELAENYFTGTIPTSLGNLPFLNHLNLASNALTTSSFTGLSFISSLTNCVNLQSLAISHNPLTGNLPPSIGNFSNLVNFYARYSGITGKIPHEIGNLSTAILFSLDHNDLQGSIPTSFNLLQSLNILYLHVNRLQGSIPEEICEMRNLQLLYLSVNTVTGIIPYCLANVTTLQYLHLASNMLSSNIPENLFSLNQLRELNISDNSLTGAIPQNIENLQAAVIIDFHSNQLSGTLPTGLSNLHSLSNFSLSHNQLQGTIPESVGSLLAIEYLDLSHNNLVGSVPRSLESLVYMKYLNVSFNKLSGQIPNGGPFRNFTYESFMRNEALCGAPWLQLPPCPQASSHGKKVRLSVVIVLVPIISTIFSFATVVVLIKYWRRKRNQTMEDQSQLATGYERISYYELQQATNDFNESNLLATGGFGSVYQGKRSNGTMIAIKVLNIQSTRALRSFGIECELLTNLRHRNLLKVISSCSNLDFRALVLEYMPNGSLDKWLYCHNNFLDIAKRLDIMIDVAAAMEYLHHGYSTPVVHCDLKPSNVLLDEYLTGYVSDFGLSKIFGLGEFIAQTQSVATAGYMAPEYGSKGLVSTSSDVYSYGILLMELFSRKRPSDEMFGGDLTLKSWIVKLCPNEISRVVDENLILPETVNSIPKLQCLKHVMELALMCCAELPDARINMIHALTTLKKIRAGYQKVLC